MSLLSSGFSGCLSRALTLRPPLAVLRSGWPLRIPEHTSPTPNIRVYRSRSCFPRYGLLFNARSPLLVLSDRHLLQDYLRKRAELFDPTKSSPIINKGTPIASSDTVLFEVVDQYGNGCSYIQSNCTSEESTFLLSISLTSTPHRRRLWHLCDPERMRIHVAEPRLQLYARRGTPELHCGTRGHRISPAGRDEADSAPDSRISDRTTLSSPRW